MNPFDLPGPQFLLFYLIFAAVVLVALVGLRRLLEAGPAPKIDIFDPYLIADLRGGTKEALSVAMVSLADRGLLAVNGTEVKRTPSASPQMVRKPIEHAILSGSSGPTAASSLLIDTRSEAATDNYRGTLETAHLERAASVVSRAPLVENIATLSDPPASDRDEAAWVSERTQKLKGFH